DVGVPDQVGDAADGGLQGGGDGWPVHDLAVVVDVPSLQGGRCEVAWQVPESAQQFGQLSGHDAVVVLGLEEPVPVSAQPLGSGDVLGHDVVEQDLVDLGYRVPHEPADRAGGAL